MPNPIKAVSTARRLVIGSNKDIKTNKNINKRLEKTFNTKTISQGAAKVKRKVGILDSEAALS